MCRIYSGPGRIVQVSREEPIIGYRLFAFNDRGFGRLAYLRPMFNYKNIWAPGKGPVYQADEPTERDNDHGIYAYTDAAFLERPYLTTCMHTPLYGSLRLYGQCKVGFDAEMIPVAAAEFAEVDAIFVDPIPWLDRVASDLRINYPDIPILEV